MPKILFLAANPANSTQLQLDEEIRAIDQSLRMASFRASFELYSHWAVRYGDMAELLLRYAPQLVHFSGHGNPSGEIVLASPGGDGHAVSATALGHLFENFKSDVRCVVLNACYSQPQAEAIAEHIECVMGMTAAISDVAAAEFSAAFYVALGYGRSVQSAFNLACNRIDLAGLGEQDTPKLLARSDPDQIFLAAAPPAGKAQTAETETPSGSYMISGQIGDLGAGAQAAIGVNISQADPNVASQQPPVP